jgi:hypothetical protein
MYVWHMQLLSAPEPESKPCLVSHQPSDMARVTTDVTHSNMAITLVMCIHPAITNQGTLQLKISHIVHYGLAFATHHR